MQTSRRNILSAGVAGTTLLTASTLSRADAGSAVVDQRPTAAARRLRRNPFTLGVASGDPDPQGFVIWTRLAPSPLEGDGLGGMPSRRYQVRWQVARDARFRRIERRGTTTVGPETAHAVHVEVDGLPSGREYHYRFLVEGWDSPTGLARTTPGRGARTASMLMAFTSCSNYPVGYFTAYRHLAEERPDLVLHLGDYQYEYAEDPQSLRRVVGPETTTLAGYRQRHAQYKTDADLQAAHAAAPWLVIWDDHEFDNNYAGLVPERPEEGFAARRAASYRAYWENMPLRRSSVPRGPDMRLFRRVSWGDLATFHMLDTRQYRSDQACGDGYDDCPDAADPARTLMGPRQEEWLTDGFAQSRARWDLLGQQVFFGRRDNNAGPSNVVSMDSWDGYPAARDRVMRAWRRAKVRNPLVLTGDVHAHWASDVLTDWEDPSTAVGSELITSSVTSGGNGYDEPTGTHPWAPWNPNLKFWTNLRGYVRTTITRDSLAADFRCVPAVTTEGADVFTRRSYVVEDRVRGLQQTADNPLPASSAARRRLPSDAEIIADTIEQES